MLAKDFQFDGEYLRNWGFMICSTEDHSGFESISRDSNLKFNNVSFHQGKLFELTTSEYEDRVEISFQICKYTKTLDRIPEISVYELREIKRWLCQPTFKKFRLIQPEWDNIYMEGSFNISDNLGFDGKIYVLDITFISNRPFALHDPITYRIKTSEANEKYILIDNSDEIGYIYPNMEVMCLESGNLEITNSNENRTTIIKNCLKDEVITFSKELLFHSSILEHIIQNDFNYIFLRISNSYKNRKNILTFSMPVKAEISYSPYVKAVY